MSLVKIHILFVFCLLFSCTKKIEKTPVAKVGSEFLYLEDVAQTIPSDVSKDDSTLWANDFIKNWVKQELVIQAAEENLSFELKNVQKELEEYRNSLLTYRYKKELMNQKMDTVISASEIEEYFESNQHEFVLSNNIAKVVFLKIPTEIADPETIKHLCTDNSPERMSELDDYGIRYAKSYNRFNDDWVEIEQILSLIPSEIDDPVRFLRRNKFIENTDTDYYYFICIRDFRVSGENAPLEYVRSPIKNLLLNQRKIRFLKQIDKDIYDEGIASNKFKIFNVQK